MACVRLRFYDLEIDLDCDTQVLCERMESIYRHFLVSQHAPSAARRVVIVFRSENQAAGLPARLVLDGETHLLTGMQPGEVESEAIVYEAIQGTILRRVRSHYIVHAGVVSKAGKAVILAADALHGKSTLTMRLLSDGYQFLSDDFAAIGREDGRVYPFPRSLRLRPDTLFRLGDLQAGPAAQTWLGKTLIDIDRLRPGSLGTAAEIGHVVVLKDRSGTADATGRPGERWLGVLVDRVPQALLNDLSQLRDITQLVGEGTEGAALLQMIVTSKQAALPAIQAACSRHQVKLQRVYTRKDAKPVFDRPARLTEIPRSRMALELVRRLMNWRQSDLIQEALGGSPRRLYLELLNILEPARCWELEVGPLEQMAALVASLPVESNARASLK